MRRSAFHGAIQILRFNWPYYVVSVAVLIAGTAVLKLVSWPRPLEVLGWLCCAAVAWWTIASLAASHWVYDRSPLMQWRWVPELLAERPRRWANIHSGLDESTDALRTEFPESYGVTLDIFDRDEMPEMSIHRARQETGTAIPADHAALPLPDASMDAVFLFFAAHELRKPASRQRLFGEVARILAPGARLILVEHLRDVPNLIMFGPGFRHFLPRGEWQRVTRGAGLSVDRELTITPLVHIWSLRKGYSTF